MTPNKSITQAFSVTYEYKLHFTEGLFEISNTLLTSLLENYKKAGAVKVLMVIDAGVSSAHIDLVDHIKAYCEHHREIIDLRKVLIVPGGEQSKNGNSAVEKVLHAINDQHICRHSFVIAVGGGAVIDMVGYAANIAHRGVKLIRVPTTVLAQNDAAVGVKNGVNFFDKKNFLGTFALPIAIINDSRFLTTLNQRDWISGIAEAVKVALIKDGHFFEFIQKNATKLALRDKEAMFQLIYRCAEIHMHHISKNGDPFESGSSRPLDFGHWAAHKLEQMTEYRLRHGEAVAMGIALDVTYAKLMGLIDAKTLDTIIAVLDEIGFDLNIPVQGTAQTEQLLNGLEEFREHLGGRLTITLITGIGEQADVHHIDIAQMRRAIALRSVTKEKLSC